jgi:DNA-binding transcriptional MocR family regulator
MTTDPEIETYWTQLPAMLLKKREFMYKILSSLGLKSIIPEGGYFMIADCKILIDRKDLTEFDDKRGKNLLNGCWRMAYKECR